MASSAGRSGLERFETLARLWPMLLEKLAVAGARLAEGAEPSASTPPDVASLAGQLAPNLRAARLWAEASSEARSRMEKALALNLDPERTILDTALMLEETASATLSA